MKRILTLLIMAAVSLAVQAVPAKRGQWQTLTLTDGSKVKVQLQGDEHCHFWQSEDGRTFTLSASSGYAIPTSLEVLSQQRQQRLARRQNVRKAAPRKAGEFGRPTSYKGSKKGIIILVESPSTTFKAEHTRDVFVDMANKVGYTDEYGSIGSVHDYFDSQSNGQFDLTFDVVGPVTVSKELKYYAGEDGMEYVHEMIIEACKLVDGQVKWSDYDWNDDGYVDQVYVMYAGKGRANGGGPSTIWPHEYEISSALSPDGYRAGDPLELQDMKIDTYACGPELNGLGHRDGIGTLCHEFTHCLGLPDFYDTRDIPESRKNYGMATWSLMDYGCYNSNGYVPCNYNGYERWFCGWIEPEELTADTLVTDMKPLTDNGDVYIIYNQANKDEYLILQNIQQKGWDAGAYGSGLLVMHVDYDYYDWVDNVVNNTKSRQRCTVIPADNNFVFDYDGWEGDIYPTRKNKVLNNLSSPAAKFYNKNTDGTYNANIDLQDITQNADGTVSFNFAFGNSVTPGDDDPVIEPTDGYLFYESFDKCNGKGGNDIIWNNKGSATQFKPDNNGWTVSGDKYFGGSKCATFGTSDVSGIATTPAFMLKGTTTLSFKAAAWGSESCVLVLSVNGAAVQTFNLGNKAWSDYKVEITGKGATTLTFQPTKNRFFLDEVLVVKPEDTTSIQGVVTHPLPTDRQGVWSLDGRYLGGYGCNLQPGIYIVNGRKVVK